MKKSSAQNHQLPERSSLESQALDYLRKNGTSSVPTLKDALGTRNRSLTDAEITDLVWRLVDRGEVEVEELPLVAMPLWRYLRVWERNLWFYASLATSLMTILAIYALPSALPWEVLRWILGSVFALFIPGYVTVQALLPSGRDLGEIERLALSVGLSLVVVMLIGLVLNYTPWGIRLTPIVISLTIFVLGIAVVALFRQFLASMRTSIGHIATEGFAANQLEL